MDRDRYAEAKRIFLELCDLPPGERGALLARACGSDDALRAEVESLLRHHDADTSLPPSETPTVTSAATTKLDEEKRQLRAIGPYRVIHEVGRGGMGVVYLAVREDDQFKRRVAIKLLKRGMDTEEVLKRFKLEEQLLAAMNHPGIARLYNAGETEDGVPYFVMEFVEGLPIDEYCDTNRLHIDERLQLFQKVCAAVHYAHQNLIVHRDLKPSNIIVNAQGDPKLLDFGIAKVIHPEFSVFAGDPTAPELRIMTPEYASPEQVRGLQITTASDIYSLGVILYEMVSGHRPYHLRSRVRDELERIICEEDPERPSTALSRTEEAGPGKSTTRTITPESVAKSREIRPDRLRRNLAGDIDNIVLMAMRKEPQRRYRSAEQLAEDIRRHLDGHPVIARPDTLSYRVSKFVKRNRGGVAAAAIIAILLAGGLAGTSMGYSRAKAEELKTKEAWAEEKKQRAIAEEQEAIAVEQRERADHHVGQLMKLSHTFMFDIHDKIQQLSGALPAREILVVTARKYLDDLASELSDDPKYQHEVANAYLKVGDIYGSIRNPIIADLDQAMDCYRTAMTIWSRLDDADPGNPETLKGLAEVHQRFADIFKDQGDRTESLKEYRAQLEILESLARKRPDEFESRRGLSVALGNVGAALVAVGESQEALEYYSRSLGIRERLAAERPEDTNVQRSLATGYLRMGGRLNAVGDYDGALDRYQQAVRVRERLVVVDPDSARFHRDLAVAKYFVGDALLSLGRPAEALDPLGHYLRVAKQRREDDPTDTRSMRDVVAAHEIMGHAYVANDDWRNARVQYDAFHAAIVPLSAQQPSNTQLRMLLARSHEMIARVAEHDGDLDAALRALTRSLEIIDELAREDPADILRQQHLASLQTNLGVLYMSAGRNGDALLRLDGARVRYEDLIQREPEDVDIRNGSAATLHELSKLRLILGEPQAAIDFAEQALAAAGERTASMLRDLAAAHFAAGAVATAIDLADEAVQLLEAGPDDAEMRAQLEDDLRRYRSP